MAQLFGLHTHLLINIKLRTFNNNSYVSYLLNVPYLESRILHRYTPILTYLSFETLEQHRLLLDLYFSYKLLNKNIDCSVFLSLFSFHIPTRNTRFTNTFYINNEITNYANNIPQNRIIKTINELKIDLFFSPNFNLFKNYCKFIFSYKY